MSKTSQISGGSGEWLLKGRDRYINPAKPLIDRVQILQRDNDSWSKALQVTLTFVRSVCPRRGFRHRFEQTGTRSRYQKTRKPENTPTREIRSSRWHVIYGAPAQGSLGKHMKWECSKQRPWRGRRIAYVQKWLAFQKW